jgi:uncharacterized membrane protein YedE/YeeE
MKQNVVAFLAGLVFALGLGISGMTDPRKVIGFLDLFGAWDPTLMFVMGGAILVHAPFYILKKRLKKPLVADRWHVPADSAITKPLLLGAFLFGIGWGLAGYCPGPAVVSLAKIQLQPFLFVICMIIGFFLFRRWAGRSNVSKTKS